MEPMMINDQDGRRWVFVERLSVFRAETKYRFIEEAQHVRHVEAFRERDIEADDIKSAF